ALVREAPQRQVLEEGPVAVPAAPMERDPRSRSLPVPLGLVVVARLDFVVVPDRYEGVRGVHRLEVPVALVQAVLGAVLLEELGVRQRIDARPALVARLLVDVVADRADEVEVLLLGEAAVRRVVAGLVRLARGAREP